MNALIIEDEAPAAKRLRHLLADTDPDIRVIGVLESVHEAIEWLQKERLPDLILSDIQLSDGLSFEIFKRFPVECPLIFTTAYDEYALQAFRVHSIDYLLKPIIQTELAQALGRVKKQLAYPTSAAQFENVLKSVLEQTKSYRQRFLVKSRDEFVAVRVEEVAYFAYVNEVTRLVRSDGKWFALETTLDEVMQDLNPLHFFRANRQYVVQANSVQKIHKHFNGKLKIELNPSTEEAIFVSRDKADEFKNWLDH